MTDRIEEIRGQRDFLAALDGRWIWLKPAATPGLLRQVVRDLDYLLGIAGAAQSYPGLFDDTALEGKEVQSSGEGE